MAIFLCVLFILSTLFSSGHSLPRPPFNETPTLPLAEVANTGPSPLPSPSGRPKYVAVGLGTQNYTCNATSGNYTATGALAQLFDATLYLAAHRNQIPSMPQTYLSLYNALPCSKSPSPCVAQDDRCEGLANSLFRPRPMNILGEHYFTSSGTPTFDLYDAPGRPFMFSKKAGVVPAPSADDVDWLYLTSNGSSENSIISSVYRVETAGGVQPKNCSGSGSIEVPYAAEYWFYR